MYDPPCVLEDSIDYMKRYVFYGGQTYVKSFDNQHVFILSSNYISDYSKVNFFATTLIRTLYPTISNGFFTIYGPALVLGMDDDTNYTSVSYPLLDTVVNLMHRFKYEI